MLQSIKGRISKFLNYRAFKKHHSKLGWLHAPKYTKYLHYSQACSEYKNNKPFLWDKQIEQLRRDGFTSIWFPEASEIADKIYREIKYKESSDAYPWTNGLGTNTLHQSYKHDPWLDFPGLEDLFRGPLGLFLQAYYQSHFKIFSSTFHRSYRDSFSSRSGSQLWHNDGGPGTCVIVGFYLHPTNINSGCLQCLSWKDSLSIYKREQKALKPLLRDYCNNMSKNIDQLTKAEIRNVMTEWYENTVRTHYKERINTPMGDAGTIVLFKNNNLHRGGFPELGCERYIVLNHIYPSPVPTPFSRYRERGIIKKGGFPANPDF